MTTRFMPTGSCYSGQPVDDSSRRSIRIVDPDPQDLSETGTDEIVIDQFFHEGQFWRAAIPLNECDTLYGQSFNFSSPRTRMTPQGRQLILNKDGIPKRRLPMLNHVQCRLVLCGPRGVRLFPMGGDPSAEPIHRIFDFVYTIEAVGPLGINFNFKDAMRGNMLCAHRFVSTQENVFERIVVENQYLIQSAPLPISREDMRKLLLLALQRSHQAGDDDLYYLFRLFGTNNCTSNPFRMLDQVVHYRPLQRLGATLYRLPLSPRLYLRIRGLDTDPRHRQLVRSEFAEFIESAETQKRKRDFVRARVRELKAARKQRAQDTRE